MDDISSLPLLDQQVEAGLRGDFERGWEIAEELARVSPTCNRAKFNRAWYEMRRGDLLKGFECLTAGRWERVFGDPPLPTDKPIWKDEDLRGKHLLLCSEGGLGDEIINARFARNFAELGAKVILTADPGLVSVFSRIEGVSAVVNHRAAPEVYHDYWVPAMSAGLVLKVTYETLSGKPYLFVHPDYAVKWKKYFAETKRFPDGTLKIGLRFWGNPKFDHEQHRRFPQELLIKAVGKRPFVSLQLETTDLPIRSWEDTLAIIGELDLVITSCTSVAHASAALGKETWIVVPVLPYYLWALPGDRSPWYDSVRLFRQTQYGRWDDVFDQVAKALDEREKRG